MQFFNSGLPFMESHTYSGKFPLTIFDSLVVVAYAFNSRGLTSISVEFKVSLVTERVPGQPTGHRETLFQTQTKPNQQQQNPQTLDRVMAGDPEQEKELAYFVWPWQAHTSLESELYNRGQI